MRRRTSPAARRAGSRARKAARDRAAEMVYPELRRIAAAYLRRERASHTLQPTALVHEAFIRLVQAGRPDSSTAGSSSTRWRRS